MKITPIAFDSLGVKSSCVQIKTNDITITIDPGIAAEVKSFPLPGRERFALVSRYDEKIRRACSKSAVVVITHYHYDHFIDEKDRRLYGNKILLIKHPMKKINHSQKGRAASFLQKAKEIAKEIHFADGKEFSFGKTKIKFSKPLWHGIKGTNLGYVLLVIVSDSREKLVFSSDLNGIYIPSYVDLIAREHPDVIILDGAPSYLLGYIMSLENLKRCVKNTIKLLQKTRCKLCILDHHLLRDYRYRELYYEAYRFAKEKKKMVLTAAELLGKKPAVLQGYEKNGPTRWQHWENYTFKKLDAMIKHAKKVARIAERKNY